ncbi:MAG: polysaccharide deacetylase, partial [Chloroflexi bacterium]
RADLAIAQIERAVAVGGMIDIWAHTEEVTSVAQQTAWEDVVSYTVGRGDVWVAPLSEIAHWQMARMSLVITPVATSSDTFGLGNGDPAQRYLLSNPSPYELVGLMIDLPSDTAAVAIDHNIIPRTQWQARGWLRIDLAAGQTIEVTMWPTRSNSR